MVSLKEFIMKNTMLKILTGGTALATLGGCTLGVVADAEKTIQRDRNDTSRLVEAAKSLYLKSMLVQSLLVMIYGLVHVRLVAQMVSPSIDG